MKECTKIDNWTPKYNFVFLFASENYFSSIFGKEFYRGPYSRVYSKAFSGSSLLQKIFRLHWSYKINRKLKLPLKRVWFHRIYRQDFEETRPLCFVYLGGNNIRYDAGLTEYIRKQNPDTRQVLLHLDLISKKCNYDYSIIRNKVDVAVTYDHDEAMKYGIHWYPGRFYNRVFPLTEPREFDTDVYFIGYAKDRLDLIFDVYHRLRRENFKCRFLLAGVPDERQSELEGVSYIKGISYEENLKYIQTSKCILEIGQRGSNAPTLRLGEAITYQRLLLTNCCEVKKRDYYIPETMSVFDNVEDADLSFLKNNIPYRIFHERAIDFSMDRFLQFLERILEEDD